MAGSAGKGGRESFLLVEEPAWPLWRNGGELQGSSYLQAGALLPPSGPRGPERGVTSQTPTPGVCWKMSRGGARQPLSSLQVGPAAALSRLPAPGARGGWVGQGGHCQASFALSSFPPRRRSTPQWETPRRGAAHRPPPGGVEEVPQRGP